MVSTNKIIIAKITVFRNEKNIYFGGKTGNLNIWEIRTIIKDVKNKIPQGGVVGDSH